MATSRSPVAEVTYVCTQLMMALLLILLGLDSVARRRGPAVPLLAMLAGVDLSFPR
jgi:hypothetical protein